MIAGEQLHPVCREHQQQSISSACAAVAPHWPLDQSIAVNPFWELKHQKFSEVASRLAAIAKVHCLMPKAYYRAQWLNVIQARHLVDAAHILKISTSVDVLVNHLQTDDVHEHWLNLSDWLDHYGTRKNRMAWRDEITHQISQFCAEFFQAGSPIQTGQSSLYQEWLGLARRDRGLEILMAEPKLRQQFEALPNDSQSLLNTAIAELAFEQHLLTDYLQALLLDINGWASWVAYLRWQARLDNQEKDLMEELLSVRLAWELVLWRHYKKQHAGEFTKLRADWQRQWTHLAQMIEAHRESQQLTWVWQRAAELAYQEPLHKQLTGSPIPHTVSKPCLQAVFCIDVRSEPIRRALEAQHPCIETLGFAGFFGLPIEYQPEMSQLTRPRLPGLLKAQIHATQSSGRNGEKPYSTLQRKVRVQHLQEQSPATFCLVEASGLLYGYRLLKNTFFPGAGGQSGDVTTNTKHWVLTSNRTPLSLSDKANLVAGVLRTMGLTQRFAETVLLIGHGSQSSNNPHAAALNCGACGGQSGEVNARILANLLNDSSLRQLLAERGITIPRATRFVPALHNTTTDEINCFETATSEEIQKWLKNAGELARQERAARFAITDPHQPGEATKHIFKRSRDWSQVRPEWGLADNASFIVAPRAYTRSVNLRGRAFLHDYDWQTDEEFRTLELIMTAPMIVTNWINMQYNASVTDNVKYGSGNKVLHNVVGGNIGVFEGNGGDLRIGLPWQSLHNGKHWLHRPQRLSVYLAAPREAIAPIVERNPSVADLINNDWLFLFQWTPEQQRITQYYQAEWREV